MEKGDDMKKATKRAREAGRRARLNMLMNEADRLNLIKQRTDANANFESRSILRRMKIQVRERRTT